MCDGSLFFVHIKRHMIPIHLHSTRQSLAIELGVRSGVRVTSAILFAMGATSTELATTERHKICEFLWWCGGGGGCEDRYS